jgi:hypothetical protein
MSTVYRTEGMSIIEHIQREAEEQMRDEGRPLTRFILTPADWDELEAEVRELARHTVHGSVNFTGEQITLNISGNPIGVIKGPP